MWKWLPFGNKASSHHTTLLDRAVDVKPASSLRVTPRAPEAARPAKIEGLLSKSDVEFLEGLVYPPEPEPIDQLTKTDQIFVGGLSKRLRARTFEVPLLPEVAIRLSELQRQVNVPISSYVALISRDASLSVEVLKAANAALYGAATTTNLSEAVMRIGLVRLQSVLMLTHLKGRILSGSPLFRRSGELLLELSLPLGFVASKLAQPSDGVSDVRFMRGMLMHVEHMVMLGALGDVSRERRIAEAPSIGAMLQAFVRFGPEIREAVATKWSLEGVLIGQDTGTVRAEYEGLRQALVCRWLRQTLPTLASVEPAKLDHTMSDIAPRVAMPEAEEAARAATA